MKNIKVDKNSKVEAFKILNVILKLQKKTEHASLFVTVARVNSNQNQTNENFERLRLYYEWIFKPLQTHDQTHEQEPDQLTIKELKL